MSILGRHIDSPDQRHRCILLDQRRLRCVDCSHTIELPAVTGSTSTSRTHPPRHEQCPAHPGEWAEHCRCCRSEQLGTDQPRDIEHRPTADVTAGAARARAAFAARRRAHRQEAQA